MHPKTSVSVSVSVSVRRTFTSTGDRREQNACLSALQSEVGGAATARKSFLAVVASSPWCKLGASNQHAVLVMRDR